MSARLRAASGRRGPGFRGANAGAEVLEGRRLLSAADLDVSFGVGGRVTTAFPGSRQDVAAAVAVTGGKTIAVGTSGGDVALARYNANGSLDTTFGAGGPEGSGLVLTDFGRVDGAAAVAVLATGKILVAGTSGRARTFDDPVENDLILARYNADGALDATFGVGGADGNGKVTTNLGGEEVAAAVAVLADGRILVAGGRSGDFLLARYTAAGVPDATFGPGGKGYVTTDFGGYADAARTINVLPSGKILLGGTALYVLPGDAPPDPLEDFALARYTANGTLDTTFGGGTGRVHTNFGVSFGEFNSNGFRDELAGVVVLADGRIVAVGTSSGASGPFRPFGSVSLARYSAAGVLEKKATEQFGDDDGYGATATAAALLPSGKILVAGGLDVDILARFNTDLTLDKTYGGGDGVAPSSHGPAVVVGPDGRVTSVGSAFYTTGGTDDFRVWRANADGTPDATFGPGGPDGSGVVTTNFLDTSGAASNVAARTMAVGADGRVLVGGSFDLYGAALARYNPDGTLDTSFGNAGLAYNRGGVIRSIALLAGGKILVLEDDADGRPALVRRNPDGTLDATFGVGGADGNGRVTPAVGGGGMAVLPDGRIVVAGRTAAYPTDFALARYSAAGVPDGGFGTAGLARADFAGGDDKATGVALGPGGTLVAAGVSDGQIAAARFDADGHLDPTFSPGGADGDGRVRVAFPPQFLSDARNLTVQADGTIDLIGAWAGDRGVVLAQFEVDGTPDAGFGGGDGLVVPDEDAASNPIAAFGGLVALPGGKLLVGGLSPTNGSAFALARLNPDGGYDPTFGTGGKVTTDFAGGEDRADAVALTPDGRIIAAGRSGGRFALAAYRGDAAASVVRIDGTGGNDRVTLAQSGTTLTATVNGAATTFAAAGVTRVVVYGLDGDDTLAVAASVAVDTTLAGGRGNDRLHGGSGRDDLFGGDGTDAADYADATVGLTLSADGAANDGPVGTSSPDNVRVDVEVLIGGAGNDVLTGSGTYNVLVGNGGDDTLSGAGGRDVLIGGAGKDKLSGGSDDDLLVGSRTTFDADLPLLRTLSVEWRNPARAYADRVSRLRFVVPGARIDTAHVPNDLAIDTLTGGTGRDWFVRHASDLLADRAADETATVF